MVQAERLLLEARRKAGGVKRRLMRILRGWQVINLYVMQLTYAEMPTVHPPGVDVTIRELTEGDERGLEAVAAFGFYGQQKDDLLRFLRAGQRLYVAEHEGRPVCHNWRVADEYYDHVLKRHLRFSRDEEYQLGGYTMPAFRGMGILPHLFKILSEEHMRDGRALKAFGFVRTSNRAMQRSLTKSGWIRIGRIGFIECLGIRWNFLTGPGVLPETKKRNFFSAPGWK